MLEITEVKVYVKQKGRLRGFSRITFNDSFVVRGLKIIEGDQGLFIAMPNRRIKRRCPECGFSNPIGHNYCGKCGLTLPDPDYRDRRHEHRDIAHPINNETRDMIEEAVLQKYRNVSRGGVGSDSKYYYEDEDDDYD
jgi:stage V sporulation protein G